MVSATTRLKPRVSLDKSSLAFTSCHILCILVWLTETRNKTVEKQERTVTFNICADFMSITRISPVLTVCARSDSWLFNRTVKASARKCFLHVKYPQHYDKHHPKRPNDCRIRTVNSHALLLSCTTWKTPTGTLSSLICHWFTNNTICQLPVLSNFDIRETMSLNKQIRKYVTQIFVLELVRIV